MSKDKMIEWLEVLHKQIEVPELTKNGRIMAVDILFHEVETALEEVPEHGQWIYENLKGQFCSVCHEQSVWKFNYCPNCGSRMEGEE